MKSLNWFGRLRIGTRVYAGFAFTLALSVALGLTGMSGMQAIHTSIGDLFRVTDQSIFVLDTKGGFAEMRRLADNGFRTDDPALLAAARSEIARLRNGVAGYQASDDVGRAARQSVADSLARYAGDFETAAKLGQDRSKIIA
jgi:hypothetical protein